MTWKCVSEIPELSEDPKQAYIVSTIDAVLLVARYSNGAWYTDNPYGSGPIRLSKVAFWMKLPKAPRVSRKLAREIEKGIYDVDYCA